MEDCRKRYKGFKLEVKRDRKPKNLAESILKKRELGLNPVIAEIKPSSPSGMIREINDVRKIAEEFIKGKACAISVLTEERYFRGSLDNLTKVSEVSTIPVIRKDFIFCKSQVYESYYYGADSLLIISSFFSKKKLKELVDTCRNLNIEPLVEVHELEDIEKSEKAKARLFCINSRDKDTLKINLNRIKELSQHIKGIKIGASGIKSREDLRFILNHCDAALIGTAIMQSEDIVAKVREFVHAT